MNKYQAIVSDVIKYSAIIGMYLLLQHLDPLQAFPGFHQPDPLLGKVPSLQNRLVVAGFSVVASLVLLDFLLGKPTLKFAWLVGGRPVLGGWPELRRQRDGALQEVEVKITLSGSGVLYHVVKLAAKSGKVRSQIKFTPSKTVMASLRHGRPHHDFNVEQDTLETSYVDGFTAEGTFPAAFTFMLPGVEGMDRQVGCDVSWRGTGWFRRVFLWLAVDRTPGISGFNLKGD